MGETGGLEQVAAMLALRGISRREAARQLHISYSALNKKLRGQARLHLEELRALEALLMGPESERERSA